MVDNQNGYRLNLAPLAHDADPVAHEQAITAILREAGPELTRRRMSTTAIGQVARWWGPVLPLAAALTLVAAGVLAQVTPGTTMTDSATPGLAQWLGIPTPVSAWIENGRSPDPVQVFAAFEEER